MWTDDYRLPPIVGHVFNATLSMWLWSVIVLLGHDLVLRLPH
jgi:hypothetical protein